VIAAALIATEGQARRAEAARQVHKKVLRERVADLVDNDVARGQKLILVQYCFRYRTFDIPRHSLVCYYYRKGVSVRNSLNLCEFEQKANYRGELGIIEAS
jgi:hypothetical protein